MINIFYNYTILSLIIYNVDHLKCGKCRNKMVPVLKQFVLLFVLGFFGTVSNDLNVRLEL